MKNIVKYKYKILGKNQNFNEYINIINPTNEEILGMVPSLNKDQINEIYKFAKKQQIIWKEKTISERAKVILEWAKLIEENKNELANTLVKEIAKNYNDSINEIERTIEYIKYTIEEMYRINLEAQTSEQFYNGNKNKIAITKREPYGIVLVISPFNYPINLSISKIIPAIISGNVVVFKSATQGSIVSTKLINLLEKTNIEPWVINFITGKGSKISDFLVENENINFVNFTGSTKVGQHISKKLSLIPHVMELGGKDASIILDDLKLNKKITKDLISGAFSYSGQRCTATKRVLVSENKKEELEKLLLEEIKNVSVGNPENNAMVTPIIDRKSIDFLKSLLNDLNPNAKILFGNKIKKNIFYPTLVTNVSRNDKLAIEEQFGPILPIITYKDIEEAIEIVNENELGLQASIYGNDINKLFYISNKLNVGTINFNSKSSRGPDNFPFVGYKKSGMGTQGIRKSIESMTQTKTIVLNLKNE